MGKPAQILTKAVRDYLTAQGWFVWKGGGGAIRAGNRFIRWGTNGAPDLFGLSQDNKLNTLLLGIEIKAGHDRQSKAQEEFQKDFEAHGGTYVIVRKTEDLDEYI